MGWAWASLLIRSGVILAAAEILRRVPRRWAAAERHRVLLAGFALLMLWPFFSALLPEVRVPVWRRTGGREVVTVEQTMFVLAGSRRPANTVKWPFAIWIAGALAALAPLVAGHVRAVRMSRRAAAIGEDWNALVEELCLRLEIRKRPEVLVARAPVMPSTFGLKRARIVLPADCADWTEVRRRAVLVHELAHVQRRDILAQLFASIAAALWWFQPLAWVTRRSLRRESERACDAVVLESGVRASDYAAELLEIAQNFSARRISAAAIPMLRRGELEGRLRAILEARRDLDRKRLPWAAAAVLTALALSASAITLSTREEKNFSGGTPMKRTLISGLLASAGLYAATIGGSIFDPSGEAIPDAKASLYNPETQARQETVTTPEGKFRFESLPAGQYILRIEKPGFASLFREFNVQQDANVERGMVLELGASEAQLKEQAAKGERAAYPQPLNPQQLRVSGEAEQAKLINKVNPVYPAAAKAARIEGRVVLEVALSAEGVPQEIRVISSPDDDLTQSALEAVRQWRYSTTLLNGRPVEIVTDVVVNYTLAR